MRNKLQKTLVIIFSLLLITVLFSSNLNAQDKKEINKKLNNITGKVEKISIKTDKGIVNFTGKEAEEILKKLKKKEHKFVFTIDDDSFFDDDNNMVFFSDDDNMFEVKSGKDGLKEKIEVKIIKGKKEVTIKTTKDGETTVKILKGKEAEEYLNKKDKHLKHLSWISKDGKKLKVMMKNHFIIKDNLDVEKTIDIKVKNGKKEITVTTIKDGKKSVKVYKGKKADNFLDELNKEDDTDIDIDDKDGIDKIIIIEKGNKTKKDK